MGEPGYGAARLDAGDFLGRPCLPRDGASLGRGRDSDTEWAKLGLDVRVVLFRKGKRL
jgi:hypothetical protein